MVAAEPVLEIDPMLRLGELVLVDDDEDVIVRHIALRRLRLVNAFAARDRSVENDLQDPPRLAIAAGELVSVFELFENRTHDLPDFRSDERRVGKGCVSTCRPRWSPFTSNTKHIRLYIS